MAMFASSAAHRSSASISRCSGRAVATLLTLILAACASDPAPIVELSGNSAETGPRPVQTPPAPASGTYRVVRGDTLYAIAFRHGLDYRDVAAWNRIDPPYRIFVGQDLRLNAQAAITSGASPSPAVAAASARPPAGAAMTQPHSAQAPATAAATVAAPRTSADKPGMFEDVTSNSEAVPESVPSVKATPEPAKPETPQPGQVAAKPPAAETPVKPPSAEPARPAIPTEPPPRSVDDSIAVSTGGVTWRWPGKGSLAGTFVAGDQTRQGIDVAGKAGDPVLAAADGEVVYSGNGLLGYGELIIVKHNANFLSAYGHNRKRLVQEGDRVRAGQQIAEMGSTASSRDELHFEIRKNGKPVNPLDYLPVR